MAKRLDFNLTRVYAEFETIVDTDIGLLRYIAANFADERIFFPEILDEDDKILKGLLYKREQYNPLCVPAIDESNMSLLDNLYNQFMEKYRSEIIGESEVTAIMELLAGLVSSDSFYAVTIICSTEFEKEVIESIISNAGVSLPFEYIITNDNDTIDATEADAIIAKYPTDLYKYENLEGKTIYLIDLICNLDATALEKSQTKYPNIDGALYFEDNGIKFITMYPYDDEYTHNEGEFSSDDPEDTNSYIDENGEIHFDFEDDENSDLTKADADLLREWLTPEDMQRIMEEEEERKEAGENIYSGDNLGFTDLSSFLFNDEGGL